MASLEIPTTIEGYQNDLIPWLDDLKLRSRADRDSQWAEALRWYAQNDLYFMLRYVLTLGSAMHNPFNVPIYDHQIYVDQCRSVDYMFNHGKGVLASARALSKSEIMCAKVIQTIANYPNVAIGLYSVQKDYGHKHLARLRGELEKNELLKLLFDDLFWENPTEASKSAGATWSKQDGLTVMGRTMNRSVPTFEVNALAGHGEVGSRYDWVLLDDVETGDNVSTMEKINSLSVWISRATSLLTPVALPQEVVLFANTQFSESGVIRKKMDTYRAEDTKLVVEIPAEIIEEKHEWAEKYCYNDDVGPLGGRIVWPYTKRFLQSQFDSKDIKEEYVLQFALSYKSFGEKALNSEAIQFYSKPASEIGSDCVAYICIDPSLGVKDPACFWVWGLTHDHRKVWLDGVRKRMDPTKPEFWDTLFMLASKWRNLSQGEVVQIRIEEVGQSMWASTAQKEMQERGCYVPVVGVKARASDAEKRFTTGKANRNYARWASMVNKGELLFPLPTSKGGKGILCKVDEDEKSKFIDIVDYFLEHELGTFPLSKTDDMLDAGGMINDEKTNSEFPLVWGTNMRYDEDDDYAHHGTTWMSAGGG